MKLYNALPAVVLAASLLSSGLSLASDGRLEISSACVDNGCFPGDDPGYPVTISQPGSYVLKSALNPPPSEVGIQAEADFVTLDLAGFSVSRTSVGPNGIAGVLVLNVGIEVRNGHVSGMGAGCIQMGEAGIVRGVLAEDCAGNGITASSSVMSGNRTRRSGNIGILAFSTSVLRENVSDQSSAGGIVALSGSVALGNTASSNDARGLFAGLGSVAVNNTASRNGTSGIHAAAGCLIEANTATGNELHGIESAGSCNVRENTARGNQQVGLALASDTAYSHNVVTANQLDRVSAGVNRGNNHCAGPILAGSTCP